MKPVKIYLAGQCKGLPDYGMGWRETAERVLNEIADFLDTKVNVFNPTDYFGEGCTESAKFVKQYYLNELRTCDLVLLNCEGTDKSIGTAQEVQFAVDHDIPVIGFGDKDMYDWIADVDCMVRYDCLSHAVECVANYYLKRC